jgi:taurine dioxygenase
MSSSTFGSSPIVNQIGGALGAVVSNLDLGKPLGADTVLRLRQVMRDHLVVVFKNQDLSEQQFKDFATYFGPVFQPPADIPVLASQKGGVTPEIIPVANVEGGYTGSGELAPHIDHQWRPYPSKGSFLYALEVPAVGGDTHWLNLQLAYDELDPDLKAAIAEVQLITFNPFLRDKGEYRPSYRDPSVPIVSPVFPHPLVRTHPESGRKILFLSYATEVEIVGWQPREGAALIERLRAHLHQPRFYYQHHWSVGDLVYWDNQATAHYRPAFDPQSRRVLQRISLAGGRRF